MLGDKSYALARMHICSFERKNGILTFDMNKYPERLCIFDKNNRVVIDVETCHQYPYVKVLYQQMFYDIEEVKTLSPDKRVGCMEYATFIYDLDEKLLKKAKYIIEQLKKGKVFPDGNEVLTNDQYLDMINSNKNGQKMKKISKKRK